RIVAVDEVEDESRLLPVVEFLVSALEQRRTQPGGERFQHLGHRAVEGELHRLCRLSVSRVAVPWPRGTLGPWPRPSSCPPRARRSAASAVPWRRARRSSSAWSRPRRRSSVPASSLTGSTTR